MTVARLTGPRGRIYSLTAEEVEAVRAQLSPAQQALAATEPNALARYPLRVTLRQGEHVLIFDERDVAALFRQVHAGAAATISRKLTPGEEKALLALYLWELAGEKEPLRNGESLIPVGGDSLRGFYITIKYPTLHALGDLGLALWQSHSHEYSRQVRTAFGRSLNGTRNVVETWVTAILTDAGRAKARELQPRYHVVSHARGPRTLEPRS